MQIFSSYNRWSDPGLGLGIRCATCMLTLTSGIYSGNRYYHQNCFRCVRCDRTPSPRRAYTNSEMTYCDKHAPGYERSYSSSHLEDTSVGASRFRCMKCNRGVQHSYYNNGHYVHPECSKCSSCGVAVAITEVTMAYGELYCPRHAPRMQSNIQNSMSVPALSDGYRSQSNPNYSSMVGNKNCRCDRCGTEVYSGCFSGGKYYHFDCIRCDRCGKKTSMDKLRQYDTEVMCSKDYKKLTGSSKTKNMISYMTPLGGLDGTDLSVHCASCEQLTPFGVYHDNKHYHVDCVRRFYGDRKFKPKRLVNDITPDKYTTRVR